MRRALVVGMLMTMAGAPSVARADVSKAECIQANTASQDARRDLKFSAAREQLARCIDPSCPGIVRDDCTRRLDELERAQPTIVFDAKDASGHDVAAVKVTIDGKPLAEKLVGSALAVDPGEHTSTFTASGGAPVTQTLIVIKEGVMKDRHESICVRRFCPGPASRRHPSRLRLSPRPRPRSRKLRPQRHLPSPRRGRLQRAAPRGERWAGSSGASAWPKHRSWHGLRPGGAQNKERPLRRERCVQFPPGPRATPTDRRPFPR